MIGYQWNLVPAAFLALVSPAQLVSAQQSVASASANAEIVGGALNITPVNPLAFGRIKSTTAGTVTISVHSIRTSDGGVVLIGSGQCSEPPCDTSNPSNPSSASYWSPAIFSVSGVPAGRYSVEADSTATATLISGKNGPMTLDVTGIEAATDSSTWNSTIGTLDAAGQGTVRVGGTLHVPAGLNASSYYLYSVDVPISVQYN